MQLRYPISDSWLGGDEEPGNAYAVLYSLQRTAGRKCDFKTYTDSEVWNYRFCAISKRLPFV